MNYILSEMYKNGWGVEKNVDLADKLFNAAEKSVAVEINLSGLRWKSEENIEASPLMRMFRIAKACGCKFTFGSDSHNKGGHEGYTRAGEYIAYLLGLCEDDVISLIAKNK